MNGLRVFYTRHEITVLYLLLWPLLAVGALLYAAGLGCRRLLYRAGLARSYRATAKVISVGGLTLGGSGKTPLVEYLAKDLARRSQRTAVLLRGYKRPASGKAAADDLERLGDEGCLLKENLKGAAQVFTRPDRRALARELDGTGHYDVFVLDDGFQHWRLRRDCDVVCVDASLPFGRPWVLPLGHLREGLGALRRADLFVLTRCDEAPALEVGRVEDLLRRINPLAGVARSVHAPRQLRHLPTGAPVALDRIKGEDVGLLAGIANPRSLARAVQKLGARVACEALFEDHHIFKEEEIGALGRECRRRGLKIVVTTQKDAPRLRRLEGLRQVPADIFELDVELRIIAGQRDWDERLDRLFRR
jgi:tetraacyldisaccharide 4'-kinase